MNKSVEKKRTKIYTDAELSVIKGNFKDNEALCKSIRAFMLQLPLTPQDEATIANIKQNKPLLVILRKAFLPTLDPEAPSQQMIDLWMTVQIADKLPEQAEPQLKAREILIEYLDQQLSSLEGKIVEAPIQFSSLAFSKGKVLTSAFYELMARNTMISHTEQMLAVFTHLANEKEETPEEALTRMKQDSSK